MNRYLLCVAVLAVAAEAQQTPVVPCGTGFCVGRSGQPVTLGGTVTVSQSAWPDGGLALIENTISGVPVQVLGNQSRSSTLPDVILGGKNSRDGGQPIVSVRTGGAQVFAVSAAGSITAAGAVNFSTANVGARFMDGGAQTLTVHAGALCLCGSQTDEAHGCKAPVSSTTATFTATTDETITYHCFP
jgi:hypothetical protein